jgi:membrane protein DedA with SNARE-associated domain
VITVLLARMLPVVQTFIAFPAGIAKMPRLRFHIYTTVGAWCWYLCLAYAGMRLGKAWETDPRFHEWFHRFHMVVELAIVAAIVWFVWTHVMRDRAVKTA